MGNLAVWLAAMVGPLVGKVLLALGFQVVSITGALVVVSTLKAMLVGHLGSVSAAGLQLALLAGTGEAFGIIFGAITARMVLWQITQGKKILGVASS
jgi:hypothetical protein